MRCQLQRYCRWRALTPSASPLGVSGITAWRAAWRKQRSARRLESASSRLASIGRVEALYVPAGAVSKFNGLYVKPEINASDSMPTLNSVSASCAGAATVTVSLETSSPKAS